MQIESYELTATGEVIKTAPQEVEVVATHDFYGVEITVYREVGGQFNGAFWWVSQYRFVEGGMFNTQAEAEAHAFQTSLADL